MIGPSEDNPPRNRVREALETRAETITVAYSQCFKMVEDAVKSEGLENPLEVLDLEYLPMKKGIPYFLFDEVPGKSYYETPNNGPFSPPGFLGGRMSGGF